MKTKMKTWTRVLLVCITMSLFCVKAHSITDAQRQQLDPIELNALIKNAKLK